MSNERAVWENAKISSSQSQNACEYWQQPTLSSDLNRGVTEAVFHRPGTFTDTNELLTTCKMWGAITGSVIFSISIETPSTPQAFEVPICLSAADSWGSVAGWTLNEPAHTRGGR